ncbi:MAG: DNA methyltransferase, partial [Gemmatimonadetes bacterium]|nr:DNA methyltransferase [Gemmatimonadota bacterium]
TGVPNYSTWLGASDSTGSDAGDPVPCVVLDPFAGSGTVALVANEMGRGAILCEISHKYAEMARQRILDGLGMFAKESEQ